jgi:transaldolase
MLAQAIHFNEMAPNMQVKMATTAAGIKAYEEATYAGVSINATISFTVSQAVAVAEAVERGLKRREAEGLPIDNMSPVCTIMIGRVDDWVKESVAHDDIVLDPGYLEWCGVAVFKNAYRIYQERGYRIRLLTAAYRNIFHWSEFLGGDCCMTITHQWQKRINDSNWPVEETMSRPVDPKILEALKQLPEFVKAYEEGAQKPEDFENYGAFRRTLSTFLGGYDELLGIIRKFMVLDAFA